MIPFAAAGADVNQVAGNAIENHRIHQPPHLTRIRQVDVKADELAGVRAGKDPDRDLPVHMLAHRAVGQLRGTGAGLRHEDLARLRQHHHVAAAVRDVQVAEAVHDVVKVFHSRFPPI